VGELAGDFVPAGRRFLRSGLGVDLVAGAVGLGEGEGIGTASALAVNAAEGVRAAAAVRLEK
jgi:hypothetical protein